MVIEGMIHTRAPIVDMEHSMNLLVCHRRPQVVGKSTNMMSVTTIWSWKGYTESLVTADGMWKRNPIG